MTDLEHPFWQAVSGEIEPPPCCKAVGCRVIEAEPSPHGPWIATASGTAKLNRPKQWSDGGSA